MLALVLLVQGALAGLDNLWQLRTAWTEHPNELSIRWSSYVPQVWPMVSYRAVECNTTDVGEWKYKAAERELFHQGKLFFEYEFIYTAIIEDLDPKCYYEYHVGTYFYWSKVRKISGLTPGNDNDEPIALFVLGDLGVGSNSSDTRAQMTRLAKSHAVVGAIHVGDMGYDLSDNGGYRGDQFMRDIDPIASRIAYMTMPGNHEHWDNFTQYVRRFRMPEVPEAEDTSFFYSFDIGKAHFTILNSEAYFYLDTVSQQVQQDWLVSDLAAANANRAAVPWLFVFAHKPLYCNMDWTQPLDSAHTNTNCGEQATLMKEAWEDLFYDNQVDVYFSGHVHNYQRMKAIYQNQTVPSEVDTFNLAVNPEAPIYILTGDAGSDHGHEPLSPTPQEWNVIGNEYYGFGVITVYNSTHSFWKQYNSADGSVVDSLWVVKQD
mmetsp:Transcript_24291/g.43210  ORF Transcript_24291/g.43210 Transcript_24291/m.43210 type:complete len:432 (-) Transcript_24291:27-1322(-)